MMEVNAAGVGVQCKVFGLLRVTLTVQINELDSAPLPRHYRLLRPAPSNPVTYPTPTNAPTLRYCNSDLAARIK